MTKPANATDSRRRFSFIAKAFLGLFFATFTFMLAGAGWFAIANYRDNAELDTLVSRIQATGDPLTGAELNAYYALPDDVDDLTAEYTAALRMFDERKLSSEEKLLPFVGVPEEPPSPGKAWDLEPAAERYLESVRPQVDALRALAMRRGAVRYPIDLAEGINTLLPDAQRTREAARRLRMDVYLRLRKGDRAGACQSLLAMFRLSETLAEEPLLTSQLVRTALFFMSVKTAEYVLESGVELDDLERLEQLLQEINVARGMRRCFRGERSIAYQTIFSPKVTSRDLSDGAVHLPKVTLKSYTFWRPHDALQLLERMTAAVSEADLPLPEGLNGLELVMVETERGFILERRLPLWRRRLLAPLLMPSVGTAGAIFGRQEAERGALLGAIGVERYRRRTGVTPDNFAQLLPEDLPSVPLDPFTGESLQYLRHETGFTIYSVGRDCEDQGGVVHDPHGKQPDVGVRIEVGVGATEPN